MKLSTQKKKIISWLHAKKLILSSYIALAMCDLCSLTAYANGEGGGGGAAEAKWNAIMSFITPWVNRLGGVVIFIGAIEFGLAWKDDNAEGKTRGMRTVIAGCIVMAVGASSSIFLAP